MIKILTSSKEGYEKIKKLVEANKNEFTDVFVDVHAPSDSIAPVVWSIEDVKNYFPKGTSDEFIESAFRKIEIQLKADMVERGWNTIEILSDVLKEG